MTVATTRFSGRTFSAQEMTLIRGVVRDCSGLSRMELARGRRAVDPFSFDSDPRDAETSWYIDSPSTVSTGGAAGGTESVTATLTVWVSRPAANDAAGQAVLLAADLLQLRHKLASLDVGDDGRVNVGERITTTVRPRGPEAVTVVGRTVIEFDYEADSENP